MMLAVPTDLSVHSAADCLARMASALPPCRASGPRWQLLPAAFECSDCPDLPAIRCSVSSWPGYSHTLHA